jgi:hypothetical protein
VLFDHFDVCFCAQNYRKLTFEIEDDANANPRKISARCAWNSRKLAIRRRRAVIDDDEDEELVVEPSAKKPMRTKS